MPLHQTKNNYGINVKNVTNTYSEDGRIKKITYAKKKAPEAELLLKSSLAFLLFNLKLKVLAANLSIRGYALYYTYIFTLFIGSIKTNLPCIAQYIYIR